MNKEEAEQFAREWVKAWNAHDLERVLSHYEDDFEMHSPAIAKLAGVASGVLRGRQAVGAYWAGALAKYSDLRFELLHVLRGADSLTLIYNGVLGLSAEVFHFGEAGKVERAYAHYDI